MLTAAQLEITGNVPALSKWKKRHCILRYRASSGPLVMEFSKDEKPSSKDKETVVIADLELVALVAAGLSGAGCHRRADPGSGAQQLQAGI